MSSPTKRAEAQAIQSSSVRSQFENVRQHGYTTGMKPTELRRNLYRIFDRVLSTGERVYVERNGGTIKIEREAPADRLAKLAETPRSRSWVGDYKDTLGLDWSEEWSES